MMAWATLDITLTPVVDDDEIKATGSISQSCASACYALASERPTSRLTRPRKPARLVGQISQQPCHQFIMRITAARANKAISLS